MAICLVFLLIYRVSALRRRLAHVAGPRLAHTLAHAHVAPRAVATRTSQNVQKQYFETKQTRTTQNVWRDVVRPSRCNAFAIARCLVSHVVLLRTLQVMVNARGKQDVRVLHSSRFVCDAALTQQAALRFVHCLFVNLTVCPESASKNKSGLKVQR